MSSAASNIWQAGTRFGPYEILAPAGWGDPSELARARHCYTQRQVWLRFWADDPTNSEQFPAFCGALAELDHPNLDRLTDAGVVEGRGFLAHQFLEGWPLERMLHRPVPTDAASSIMAQVLRGLAYLHDRGRVHGDLEPGSVLIGPSGVAVLLCRRPEFWSRRLEPLPLEEARNDLVAATLLARRLLFQGETEPPGPPTDPAIAALYHLHSRLLSGQIATAAELLEALRQAPNRSEMARSPTSARPSDPPKAVREERAVLSLDVVGSTRMKQPGFTMAIQNQFSRFRRFVGERLRHSQCVEHLWAGDGLLALFSDVDPAVACVGALLDELPGFNARRLPSENPIRIRAGIHYGPVQRFAGQPLGEIVSRTLDYAAHMQKHCAPDGILVSEAAWLGMADRSGWRPADDRVAVLFPFPILQQGSPTGPRRVIVGAVAPLRLGVVTADRQEERRFVQPVLIGRLDPAATRRPDISLAGDEAVSRRHAVLRPDGAAWVVEDLESANGTLLNGVQLSPRSPVQLRPGDEIRLGEKAVLRILQIGESVPL